MDLWRGGLTLRRAAVLAVHLPAGAVFWQATGGPRAWSDEVAALMRTEYRLQILAWLKTEDGSKGRNPPDPAEPPPFIGDEQAKADKNDTKAKAFLRRQQQMQRRTTE